MIQVPGSCESNVKGGIRHHSLHQAADDHHIIRSEQVGKCDPFAGSSRSSGKVGNHPENHPHIIRSEQVGKCDPLCRIIKQFRKGWQPSRKPSSPKNNPMKFSHSTSWLEVSPVEQAPLKIADEVHPLDFMTRKFTFSSSMVAAHPSQGVGKP